MKSRINGCCAVAVGLAHEKACSVRNERSPGVLAGDTDSPWPIGARANNVINQYQSVLYVKLRSLSYKNCPPLCKHALSRRARLLIRPLPCE